MRKLSAAGSGPVNIGQVVPWRTGSVKGGAIPLKRGVRDRWADTSKYTADNLPAIRKRKGVGRPIDKPARVRLLGHITVYPALIASHWGRPSPNLAEWHRKQRRGESVEDYRLRAFNLVRDGISRTLAEWGRERV